MKKFLLRSVSIMLALLCVFCGPSAFAQLGQVQTIISTNAVKSTDLAVTNGFSAVGVSRVVVTTTSTGWASGVTSGATLTFQKSTATDSGWVTGTNVVVTPTGTTPVVETWGIMTAGYPYWRIVGINNTDNSASNLTVVATAVKDSTAAGTLDTLTVNGTATIGTLAATAGTTTTGTITTFRSTTGTITTLTAPTLNSTTLTAGTGIISAGTVTNLTTLSATAGTITTLTAPTLNSTTLSAGTGRIDTGFVTNLTAVTAATITSLTAPTAIISAGTVTNLTSLSAASAVLSGGTVTNLASLGANNTIVTNLTVTSAHAGPTTNAFQGVDGSTNTVITVGGVIKSIVTTGP